MKKTKTILSLILATIMLLSLTTAVFAIEVKNPADVAVLVPKEDAYTHITGTNSVGKAHDPENNESGGDIAIHFVAEDRLVKFTTRTCSWGNNTGKLKFVFYRWDYNYSKTVSGDPLYSFISPDFRDNATATIEMPEDSNVSGDLLMLVTTDGDASDSCGFWLTSRQDGSQTYIKGVEDEVYAMPLDIYTRSSAAYEPLTDAPKKDAYSYIDASAFDYSYKATASAANITDPEYGNRILNGVERGSVAGYGQVDFGATSPKSAVLRIRNSSCDNNVAEVQMYIDDPENSKCIAAFRFYENGPEGGFEEITAVLNQEVTGVHDVYLVVNGTGFFVSAFWFTEDKQEPSYWEKMILDYKPVPESNIREDYSSTWTATDMLGRKVADSTTIKNPDEEKTVGLFYWTWHASRGKLGGGSANNQLIIDTYPGDEAEIKNDYNYYRWKSGIWNESIYGYYSGFDTWVMRKQLELFAASDIDALFFDTTNAFHVFAGGFFPLCEEINRMRKQGMNPPKIAFMLPFTDTINTAKSLENIYSAMYQQGLYSDTWFYWDGKPFVMGMEKAITNTATGKAQEALYEEMRDFFTFRAGQASYFTGPANDNEWPWLEIYPQHGFGKAKDGGVEAVAVGIAQNACDDGITAMNGKNVYGRSYTYKNRFTLLSETSKYYGYNFQEQWDRAFELDPPFVFITGWNEWTAGHYESWGYINTEGAYPDSYSDEYSRDIEPTKGDFKDVYYYQMVDNIRKFKGVQQIPQASEAKTIDIAGDFAQWDNVGPDFIGYEGGTEHRDEVAYLINGRNHYTNTTGRNDIILSKVARDEENLYFYVETAENLTPYTDPAWMRLLINTDRKYKTGWEGYDYIINRVNPTENTVTVEKADPDWKFTTAGEGSYSISGNKMMISIPRSVLGLTGKTLDLEFKWADNNLPTADSIRSGDIMSFYTDGDTAPIARFNYHYVEDISKVATPVDEPVQPELTGRDYLRRATVMAVNNPVALMEGNEVQIDENNPEVYPVIINDKTLIPIRFLVESIGAEVTWIEDENAAQIVVGKKRVKIVEGSNDMRIDKTTVKLQTPAQTINDRMYVPLRDIVEALDMQCYWFDPGVILFGFTVYDYCARPEVMKELEEIYGVEIA